MVNALSLSTMDPVIATSVDYAKKLRTDIPTFLDYLEKNRNFSNDFEVLLFLIENNPDFVYSEYFKQRRQKITQTYLLNIQSGKVIQNADNLVIVGSPYAMLLSSVGEDPAKDPTFEVEEDAIQCWTGRFEDGEYLAEFRSPFNSRNNLGLLHNHYHEYFTKYFNFGNLIVAINMNGTSFQDKNNGSDQDSDSIYTTNHPDIVSHAKYCYLNYPTIVNNIPKETNHYNNTPETYAEIDDNLAASQLSIGESSNLAQICLTYTYNFPDQKYQDYVCILSVLAQAAIDSAKRRFDIDISSEIKRIKKDMDIPTNGYPQFWGLIRKGFNRDRINDSLVCPMNHLSSIRLPHPHTRSLTLPMDYFFHEFPLDLTYKQSRRVEAFIEKYSLRLYDNIGDPDNHILLMTEYEDMLSDIRQLYVSSKSPGLFSWLLKRAFLPSRKLNNRASKFNRSLLMKTLYDVNKQALLAVLSENLVAEDKNENPPEESA